MSYSSLTKSGSPGLEELGSTSPAAANSQSMLPPSAGSAANAGLTSAAGDYKPAVGPPPPPPASSSGASSWKGATAAAATAHQHQGFQVL